MARPRTKLAPALEAEISARAARGESVKTIAEAIGRPDLTSTIYRRFRRPAPKPNTLAHAEAAVHEIPEIVPDNTPLETLQRWQTRIEKAGRDAETRGNLAAIASTATRAVSIADAIRKATPIKPPDPNDNPDMKALAEIGEKRLLALVNDMFAAK